MQAHKWYHVLALFTLALDHLIFFVSPRKTNIIRKYRVLKVLTEGSVSLSEAVESEDGISERLVVQLELIVSHQSRLKDTKTRGKGQERRVADDIRSHIWKSNTIIFMVSRTLKANTADWAEFVASAFWVKQGADILLVCCWSRGVSWLLISSEYWC